MKSEMAFEGLGGEGVEDIPKAGSLRDDGDEDEGGLVPAKKTEEVKLKGNPMMFKPLSVGRATQKKKKAVPPAPAASSPALSQTVKEQVSEPAPEVSAPKPKPKVSLFSLGSGDSATDTASAPQSAAYEPVVYTSNTDAPAAGPEPEQGAQAAAVPSEPTGQTLDSIADDLNLSRSQRRHLFGRQADPSKSRIIHFNTDKEYVANQELAHQTDLAAAQHNPVRSIAPGKHSLQQLVNAASSQREALEESFASGRRNKKEAGSKYGW
ncbi:mitotic checkpoint regulator, MAD2B-interacting-domain-containing protein [Aspergillus avenaceus]|uniref:Mitotic checkpoint regulator, MAD2B-interacting-domain-containing protein n=1 Tax=Aspergillus avenaceus TaxID=36643 RepID=A0A5N6TQ20_ASPAV|nr:mitotic checkpoint regulator, MAD2B-interacting-domain-containing protein [Aspergillus avenaceus]